MNIGFVTEALPYLPCHDGSRLPAANLLRCLGARHRIDLISLVGDGDEGRADWVAEHCATLKTLPAPSYHTLISSLDRFSTYAWGKPLGQFREASTLLAESLAAGRWDLLHVEGSVAAGLIPPDLPVPSLLSLRGPWSLNAAPTAAASSSSGVDGLYHQLLSQFERRYEQRLYSRFDSCATAGGAEARAIRSLAPQCRVAIIPNGVDADYFRPVMGLFSKPTLVFHGNLDYAPNVEAAVEFCRQAFTLVRRRRGDAEFHLVGANPAPAIRELAAQPGISLSADLPDLRQALGQCRVYVCPVRSGYGVTNKLLEAMAMGLPVVAYPEAVRGINCVPGKHLLVAEDPADFVRLVVELLNRPKRGEELGRAARQHVMENYRWADRTEEFEALYRQAIRTWRDRNEPTDGTFPPMRRRRIHPELAAACPW